MYGLGGKTLSVKVPRNANNYTIMLISSCSSENTRVYGNEGAPLYLLYHGKYKEYTHLDKGYLELYNKTNGSDFITRFIECIFMTNHTIGSEDDDNDDDEPKTGWFITNINNPN